MRNAGPREASREAEEVRWQRENLRVTGDRDLEKAPGGDERRAHPRLSMDLGAVVDREGQDARPARIVDFCIGGLFIMVDGQEDDYLVLGGRQVAPGDHLRITFDTEDDDGAQRHTVQVDVARLFLGGMGVAFQPPEPAAIRALQRIASSRREARRDPDTQADAEAGAILAGVRGALNAWLRRTLGNTLESARESLFVEARDATTNIAQSEFVESMKDVERVASTVRETASETLLRAFDRLDPQTSEQPVDARNTAVQDDALSLVDTASFDDWVKVKNIITRHEPEYREQIYALGRRLSAVSGKQLDELSNPLGMQQVGSAFNEATQNLGLSPGAREAIYRAFERVLVPGLGNLYTRLNEELVKRGIMPVVEKPRPAAPVRAASRAPARDTAQAGSAPVDSGEAAPTPIAPDWTPGTAAPQGTFGPEPGTAHPAAGPLPDGQPQRDGPGAPAGYQPSYHSPIHPAVSQVGMDRAYQAVRSIMGLRRAVSQRAPIPPAGAASAAPPRPGGVSPQLLSALEALQADEELSAPQPSRGNALGSRLRTALEREGVRLGPEEGEAVDVLSSLIEAVLGDPLIEENVKPRIQRLAVPLLKTALDDEAFFAQEEHPARQVVNRLGMLGLPDALSEDAEGDSLQQSVDPLLERVIGDRDAGSAAFEAILPELDALVERQDRLYRENLARVVEEQERARAMLAEGEPGESPAPVPVAPQLLPWVERTKRLVTGDVVTFKAGSEAPQPRTLAWVDEEHQSFVFADRSGRGGAPVSQLELAAELQTGSAQVQDAAEVPAMDRGVYQMVHEIHSALVDERSRERAPIADRVTGLMPLETFQQHVEDSLERARERGVRHALLAMNLDGFAVINDSCGRGAGDSLLRKLSRLLERQIGGQGHITRPGADNFLILLEDHSFQEARRFAERQCTAIENSRVVFDGEQYPITVSIGLVPLTRSAESAESMIARARAAMAAAKRRGGNQLRVFDPEEDPLVPEATADEATTSGEGAPVEPVSESPGRSLGEMLDAGELSLQRQQVRPLDEESGARPHFEVLLVMAGEDGEARAVPGEMMAGDGRVAEVDRWVLRTALEWMKANRREVIRSGGFAINLSGPTLEEAGLLEFVVEQLTETAVPPAKVIFEVTESAAIDRLSSAVDFIRTLREYGCRFSIDDFGAGHANFTYLKTLPVDYVKIDGVFVRGLPDSEDDLAMVRSINEIAHLVGKQTIAESVSSEAAMEQLREAGVDFVQGDAVSPAEPLT